MKSLVFMMFLIINSSIWANELGKTTYQLTCKTCHAPQVASGIHAPAAFDKEAWATLFKQGTIEAQKNPSQYKTSMDYLLDKASIGKGLMPHGGLCKEVAVPRKNCSNEAIIQAINYMAGN